MSTTSEVLQIARDGYALAPSHAPYKTFTARCPVVRIDRAGPDRRDSALIALANAASLRVDDGDYRTAVIKWNARSTTKTVLAAFDRAIKATA